MFSKVLKILFMILGGIVIGAVMAFVFGWLVMLLWNWLMPVIFSLPQITFWQAWGLVVLTHLLFKAGPGHKNDHDHGHFNHHTFKEKFKSKIKNHFGSDNKPETAPEA